MNCAIHPDRPAVSFCRDCGKPMCAECQKPALGSIYCAEHVPASAAPPPPPPPLPHQEPSSPYTAPAPRVAAGDAGHYPFLAFGLGFIPGVGAIYNGQYAKGLIHAVIFGLLVSLASRSETGNWEPLIGLMIAAWVFYMAFEAYHTARKRRYGVAVEEFSSLIDVRSTPGRFPLGAIILIGLGFILLLDTTDIINFDELERYWPVVLIVIGVYLLYARLGAAADRRADSNAEARR
jgi:hypothetical protein